ncbi:MAG: LON peptidase substrate-binding domain-containing protein [Acidobacteriota bacterium]
MTGQVADPAEFEKIPIFPLPNVVFFPHTLLPLHIFEPRYKQMIADALQGDRQIGMALLHPGWERGSSEGEKIFSTGGLGLISEYKDLAEGKYDLLLSGRCRYRIIEFIQETPYRIARVKLLSEVMPNRLETTDISTELALSFRELNEEDTYPELGMDVLEKLDFPTLVNSICSSLNLSVYDKQQLLEMDSLKMRSTRILGILRRLLAQKRVVSQFRHLQPKDPSVN